MAVYWVEYVGHQCKPISRGNITPPFERSLFLDLPVAPYRRLGRRNRLLRLSNTQSIRRVFATTLVDLDILGKSLLTYKVSI